MQAIEFLLKAKNEASKVIHDVEKDIGGLNAASSALGKGVANIGGGWALAGLALTTAAATAVGLTKNLAEQAKSLDLTAKASGTTAEQVQLLRRAFVNAGATSEAADTALKMMTRSIGQNSTALKNMGITTRNSYDAMLQFADKLELVSDAGNRAALKQAVLGRAWKEAGGALPGLRSEIGRTREVYAKWDALFGGGTMASAEKVHKAFEDLSMSMDAMKIAFAVKLAPAVAYALEQLLGFVNVTHDIQRSLPGVGTTVKLLGDLFRRAFDFQRTHEDFVELGQDLTAVKLYFTEGADAAKRYADEVERAAKARGSKPFGGFDTGKPGAAPGSRGKGGSGGWETPPSKPIETGLVVIGTDEDGNPVYGFPTKGSKGGGAPKESPRQKQLEQLMQTLRVGKALAEQVADALDRVAAKKAGQEKVAALKKEMSTYNLSSEAEAAVLAADEHSTDANLQPRKVRQPVPIAPAVDTKELEKLRKAMLDAMPKFSQAIIDVGVKWADLVNEVTSSAGIIDQSLEGLWNGLQSGFGQVFANLTSKTQTFRSAMRTIFNALVQEVLAILARIVAAKVFAFILKLIPGVGTFLSAAASAAAGASARPATELAMAGPVTSASNAVGLSTSKQAASTSITVNVSALDQRGVYQSLTAPRGELRSALRQAALAGAY